jgi:hypothetical protein
MSFAYILFLLIIYLRGRPDGKNTLTYWWRNWFPTLQPLPFVSSACTELNIMLKKDGISFTICKAGPSSARRPMEVLLLLSEEAMRIQEDGPRRMVKDE